MCYFAVGGLLVLLGDDGVWWCIVDPYDVVFDVWVVGFLECYGCGFAAF